MILESYTITNMAHGAPLAIGEGRNSGCRTISAASGISSSYHISKFFGIADAHLRQRTPAETESLIEAFLHRPSRRTCKAGARKILERKTSQDPNKNPGPPSRDWRSDPEGAEGGG
jgi:hypothetical protein